MKELLVATGNMGKFREIHAYLRDVVDRVYSVADFPGLPDVDEDGATFAENAVKKAASAAEFSGIAVIADDSGLLVDALGGRPGVHSARFAGEDASDADNNAKLIKELARIPSHLRTAAFQSVIALCLPGEDCLTFTGELKGVMLDSPRGAGGFGYDPLFLVPEFGLTVAELSLDIKNSISHRGKALARLKAHLFGM